MSRHFLFFNLRSRYWATINESLINSIAFEDTVILTTQNQTLRSNQIGATYQWLDCDNGNEPIEGANERTYAPTKSGNYAVKLTYNNCSDTRTSDCYPLNVVTSLNNFHTKHYGLDVYPNPATEKVRIINVETGSFISIFNDNGAPVYNEVLSESNEIDLSQMTNGVYILKVSGVNQNATQKLVIIK